MTSRATKNRLARRLFRATVIHAKANTHVFHKVQIAGRDLQIYAGDKTETDRHREQYTWFAQWDWHRRRAIAENLDHARTDLALFKDKRGARMWLQHARSYRS